MEFTVNQIAEILNGEVDGNGEQKIIDIGKIQNAGSGYLTFLSNPKYESYVYTTDASAVLVQKDFKPRKKVKTILIRVDDPYLRFTQIVEEYSKQYSFRKSGVENPSFIGKNSSTGKDIYRGAFSYIGDNVTIGDNAKIYPHVYIGDNVKIGNSCLIYPGVKIYEDSVIGNDCVLHAGAVIGSDGFGYAPKEDGSYQTIPQMGNVILEDNVHIGANTTVDCATFKSDSTVIGLGVKLDNLIMVAHNVRIGSNTVIAAQSGVSGSSTIGKNCIIAGQVGIVGHIDIKDRTTIAAQSGVTKTEKEDSTLMGSPSFDHKEYLKAYAVFRRLPELNRRLKQLEEKILNLPAV